MLDFIVMQLSRVNPGKGYKKRQKMCESYLIIIISIIIIIIIMTIAVPCEIIIGKENTALSLFLVFT